LRFGLLVKEDILKYLLAQTLRIFRLAELTFAIVQRVEGNQGSSILSMAQD